MRAVGGLVVDVIDADDDGLAHDVIHGHDREQALDRPEAAGAAARFGTFVHARLVPALAQFGFDQRPDGVLAAARANELAWLIDVEPAPWSVPERICFTLAWGIHVPGLDTLLADPVPVPTRLGVDRCPISGRLGQHADHIDPLWFTMRERPWTVAPVRDQFLVRHLVSAVTGQMLPELGRFTTAADVQQHLAASLPATRGAPSADELRTIRRVAAISALVGERQNALRWLDYLEARTELAMAPDKARARVDELRERCLAS
jgi:hypothetical protein